MMRHGKLPNMDLPCFRQNRFAQRRSSMDLTFSTRIDSGRRLGEGASNKAYSVNEFSQSIEPSDMHSYRLIMIPEDVPVSWVNLGSTPDQVKNTWCRVRWGPPPSLPDQCGPLKLTNQRMASQ